MDTRPAERKAVLFSAGGVRLALRRSHVREIAACPPDRTGGRAAERPEVTIRGEPVPAVVVATVLGLEPAAGGYALLTESAPPLALRVDSLHGIVDLAGGEVFQLPSRTPLPQPPPFRAAVVSGGAVALELEVSALGWAPIPPATGAADPPPIGVGAAADRELCFSRSGRTYAVPLSLVVQVLDSPRVWPVPLAAPAHIGLVYHGRAIHPVFDLASLYGQGQRGARGGAAVDELAERSEAFKILLLDAGGAPLAVVADRVLAAGETASAPDAHVLRPPWDALFC